MRDLRALQPYLPPPTRRTCRGRGDGRTRLRLVVLMLACLGALSPVAQAGKPRCRLEQIDLSKFDKTNHIQAIGGRVELEGTLNTEQPAPAHRLLVGGKAVAKAEKAEPFERSGRDLFMALLVENSALFTPAIDKIKEALKEFLESMPPRVKVRLILFGYEIEQQPNFMPAQAVTPLIDDINPDDQGDVQLLRAITAGITALNKLPVSKDKEGKPLPPPRKVMVVLSDGLNELMDRKSFRRTGDLLHHNNIALFPIAFSPRDDRGPLLNLGELAKRSSGTFRWAQKDENLKEQFANLSEELRQTPVYTFTAKKLDMDDLLGASFMLQCADLKSNSFEFAGVPPKKTSTWWKWVLGIVLSLVGLWGLAQLAVVLLKRRAQAMGIQLPAAAGQAAGGAAMPGAAGPVAQATGPAPGAYYPVPITPGARVYTATLIGIGAGVLGGQRLKVDANIFIGKGPGALPTVLHVPDDPSLGDIHCELRRDGAGYALFDMGVPSGSYVNDRRVTGPTRLGDGDILRLGNATQFRFRLDD